MENLTTDRRPPMCVIAGNCPFGGHYSGHYSGIGGAAGGGGGGGGGYECLAVKTLSDIDLRLSALCSAVENLCVTLEIIIQRK